VRRDEQIAGEKQNLGSLSLRMLSWSTTAVFMWRVLKGKDQHFFLSCLLMWVV